MKKIGLILIAISILFFSISIVTLLKWKSDADNTEKIADKAVEIVKITEIDEEEQTEETPKKNNKVVSKILDPYWAYKNEKLINVDFYDLTDVNKDISGWIQVKGTNINYPFVQAKDNEYYLTHSLDKKNNSAGWVFLDFRNDLNKEEKNTIIYAHGRYDGTMFGTLKNALSTKWISNEDNYIIKLSTPQSNTMWEVFSVYHIPNTSDYIRVKFNDEKEFSDFGNMLLKRSQHKFNVDTINEDDRILTLSTCFNQNEKVVFHARLVKSSTRVGE